MKRGIFCVFAVAWISVLLACQTTPSLNLDTLEDRSFELTKVVMKVKAADDTDGKGEKFLDVNLANLLAEAEPLLKVKNSPLKTQNFVEAAKTKRLLSKMVVVDIPGNSKSEEYHEYRWELESTAEQYAAITFPLAFNAEKSYPGFLILCKKNPKQPDVPFMQPFTLDVGVK